MGEAELQRNIIRALESRGWLVWRLNSGMAKVGKRRIRLLPAGSPDLQAMRGGRLEWLEVKDRSKARVTGGADKVHEEQQIRRQLELTLKAGFRVHQVHSVEQAIAAVGETR